MNGVLKYISPEYFQNKTLLEVGCGHADIGNMFSRLGAVVTSSDGRKEHLEIVKQKYPSGFKASFFYLHIVCVFPYWWDNAIKWLHHKYLV